MLRSVVFSGVFMLTGFLTVAVAGAASIPIENASFEGPAVDPAGFPVLPYMTGWTELDVDAEGSTNTGVFGNTPADSADHVINADGSQLAFLGSQQGNALEQDLASVYKAGCDYRMTVAVCVSGQFPPSAAEPLDTLELVLYYRDENEPVEIAHRTVQAGGLSATQLRDFSVYLPEVNTSAAWASKPIGIALRAVGLAGGFWDLDHVRLMESVPASIPIENASFEGPAVDPNGFPVLPYMGGWTEVDVDTEGSTNTGVFGNTPEGSPDRVLNADGNQLAFLGSQEGNALEQDLAAVYQAGGDYRLTVAVGVSGQFPPAAEAPADTLELVLYYRDGNEPVDIVYEAVPSGGLSSTELQDFSAYLPTVSPDDAWAGKPIGVAIRSVGLAGGFWDLDHVRLVESLPASVPVENPSFEGPTVDLGGFPVLPYMDGWVELDVDTEGSTNTGVFANTPADSWDHMPDADGSQLAFLGSQQGNALEQDLATTYNVGSAYRLTAAVGVSGRFAPSSEEPVDTVELVLYYNDGAGLVDIAREVVEAPDVAPRQLQDFSVYLPMVGGEDPWAGQPIGIAIRSLGLAGGFWDLDNVRLAETPPEPDTGSVVEE